MNAPNRNDLCPCGSGKKYKLCCLRRDDALASEKRAGAASAALMLQSALAHHRAGRLIDAEAFCRKILQAEPDHPDALLLSGAIAYQLGQNETAVELMGRSAKIKPSVVAHYKLGVALSTLGRLAEAEESCRSAISLKSDYFDAHCHLGMVLKEQGKLAEALACYLAAHAINPNHADVRYNLGFMYMMTKQMALAEEWYRKALELDPDRVSAHANLSWLLREAGRLDEAQQHRDLAYRKQCLFATSSPSAVRTVLMLLDVGKGNMPFQFLFPARENNMIKWVIEYATEDQYRNLPPYDVVFNAIGDPGVIDAIAEPWARFMGICDKPVLNAPATMARTARHLMPELLAGVEGILVPDAWRVEQKGEWFANPDFQFPVLVRPLTSQGGEGLTLVESRAALADMVPDRTGVVHMCNYHDYRSADGCFRKYRIIFVDRRPYPYHLAISEQWMVHYQSANMLLPWKLEEERRFLEDPAGVLGAVGMAAIEAIGKRLDLDYAGVDFSILPDGRLLIFEANTSMLAHPEHDDILKFKNSHVQEIFDAFGDLLARSSGKGQAGGANP
jgi:Tfp pilus assembly protein PilF